MPALVSLLLLFSVVFYLHIKPSYAIDIREKDKVIWQLSGNDSSIKITYVNDKAAKQSSQYLWIQKDNQNQAYKVGLMPHQANGSVRYALPAEFGIDAGDKLIISDTNNHDLLNSQANLVIPLNDDAF